MKPIPLLFFCAFCSPIVAQDVSRPASASQRTEGERTEIERIEIEVGEFTFDARAAGPADGELVLLLHGFPQTSHAWRHQLRALGSAGFRAVAPDQRGYSPRARPEEIAAYAMREVVADAAGMIAALGREQVHLVGHDWGGAVAWAFAARFPDRVRTLTVLSTPHFAAFGAALAKSGSEQAKRSSYFEVFGAPGAEKKFLADDAAFLRGLFGGSGLEAADIDVYVDALADPKAMRAALNWYSALLQARSVAPASSPIAPSGATAPPKIAAPTLYVWSDADPAFGRAPAEATAGFVSGPYRFEVLEGISHWIPEQAAERVNAWLLEHLRAHGSK